MDFPNRFFSVYFFPLFTEEFFPKLYGIFERICEKIQIEEDLEPELIEMAKLAYITTGNGYYLYQKGMIEI